MVDHRRQLSLVELASLGYDYEGWMRSKQRIVDGRWRSWGTLAGRGWGKTFGIVGWLIPRIMSGEIVRMNLIGATDDHAYEVGVEDPYSGLMAWSPPWFRPRYQGGLLTWPNGAECRIYGAYKPTRIRGGGVNVVWCTELTTWQASTAVDAWDMAVIKTREGDSKILWDSTAEARNELLIDRVSESEADPERYVLVRGDTRENKWLSDDYVRDLITRYAVHNEDGSLARDAKGNVKLTRRGREEIAAEFSLDASGALWLSEWIAHRVPPGLRRVVVSIDPAFSADRGSDAVGVCVAALDEYDQFVVLDDRTARMRWEEWGDLAIALYHERNASVIVVERNKGGDAVAANIRARALARAQRTRRNLRVVVLPRGSHSPTGHDPNTIYIREVSARDSKWNRAEPVAGLYEAGLAYHARAFRDLERQMTTWEPGPGVRSPNAIDAMTQAANELVDLEGKWHVDLRSIDAAKRMQRSIAGAAKPEQRPVPGASVVGRRTRGRRGSGRSL